MHNAHGRSSMFVHGGATPGSAGCIDLVENNEDFHGFLAGTDPPMPGIPADLPSATARLLLVDYLPVRVELPRTHSNPAFCPEHPPGVDFFPCVGNPSCSVDRIYARRVPGERSILLAEICRTLKAN